MFKRPAVSGIFKVKKCFNYSCAEEADELVTEVDQAASFKTHEDK